MHAIELPSNKLGWYSPAWGKSGLGEVTRWPGF